MPSHATFPTGDSYAPSLGLSGKHDFSTLEAKFGNGYRQVTQEGLNAHRQTWAITWKNVPIDTGNTITTFLEARGTHDVFLWTPPKAGASAIKVRQNGYSESYNYTSNVVTITSTFEQAFEF